MCAMQFNLCAIAFIVCVLVLSDTSSARVVRSARLLQATKCPQPVELKTGTSLHQQTKFGVGEKSVTVKSPCTAGDNYNSCLKAGLTAMINFQKEKVLPEFKTLINSFVDLEKSKNNVAEVVAVIPDVKSLESSASKVVSDYDGDITRVIDLVRGTVVYKSLNDVNLGLCRLRQYLDESKTVVRVQEKNGFAKPTDGGYSDYKINFQFTNPNLSKVIVELQIHVCSLLYAKEVKGGHLFYEVVRKLDKVHYKDQIDALNEKSRGLYDTFRTVQEQVKCDMKQWTPNHSMFF